jgi:hypothetical protein
LADLDYNELDECDGVFRKMRTEAPLGLPPEYEKTNTRIKGSNVA